MMKAHNKFEKNFLKVCKELEKLKKTFCIKGLPDYYKEKKIWSPGDHVKLWSVSRTRAEVLRMFALAKKPKVILELGTSAGYSTIWLASATKEFNGKVYTVDFDPVKIKLSKKYFAKAKLQKYIIQLEGVISDVLKKWKKKIDFLFLDADKHNYYKYLRQLEPFLNRGAVIIADNAGRKKGKKGHNAHLMQDYLKYVENSPKYHSFFLDIDMGLMVSIRK
jgi:predicted O-methyltransferase YrrM